MRDMNVFISQQRSALDIEDELIHGRDAVVVSNETVRVGFFPGGRLHRRGTVQNAEIFARIGSYISTQQKQRVMACEALAKSFDIPCLSADYSSHYYRGRSRGLEHLSSY